MWPSGRKQNEDECSLVVRTSPICSDGHAKVPVGTCVGTFGRDRHKAPKSDCNFRVFGHQPKGLFKKLFKNGSGTVGTFVGTLPQNRAQFCVPECSGTYL
jgi:hypothetical protein